MPRLLIAIVVAVSLSAGCTGARAAPVSSPPVLPPDPPTTGAGGAGENLPAVGALFRAGHTEHDCSASVVHSSSGDVVLTAAHCVAGSARGMRFVPGYGPSGSGPSGSWPVTAAYAPAAWLQGQNTDDDYAFLTVTPGPDAPRRTAPQTVEGAVGSVGTPGPSVAGRTVTVVGYEFGSGDRPTSCDSRVEMTSGDPAVHCAGLGIGTSGAPWISSAVDQRGDGGVVGVVGGRNQGGCTDDVSYSPTFDATTTALLQRAAAGAPGDRLPEPGDDGC